MPLVDNGSIKNRKDTKNLIESCNKIIKHLQNSKVKLIFESDFSPKKLKNFIKQFDKNFFGINYDSGNSAALNYNIDEERSRRIYIVRVIRRLSNTNRVTHNKSKNIRL